MRVSRSTWAFLVLFYLIKDVNSAHIPHSGTSTRIVGGKEAIPHSAPYIAFILTENSKGSIIQCGGSLISPNYILTAAHCLKGRINGTVYLGAHDISKREDLRVSMQVDGSAGFKVYAHGDLGLIKLRNPVEINETISIIDLPSRADADERKTYAGRNATTYGWGLIGNNPDRRTNVLHTVEVDVMANDDCGKFFGELCTSGKNGKGTCNGDSGGPLVVDGILIGVTSYGAAECAKGFPSIYVRVAVRSYLDWIEKNSDVIIKQ